MPLWKGGWIGNSSSQPTELSRFAARSGFKARSVMMSKGVPRIASTGKLRLSWLIMRLMNEFF